MHVISRDSPCFYLTSVAKNRLPVFRTDEMKTITCAALGEARKSGGFALYAYVIMVDHLHAMIRRVLPQIPCGSSMALLAGGSLTT